MKSNKAKVLKNSGNIISSIIILTVIIFGATVTNCITHGLNLSIAVIFTLYMLFCVLLPGYTAGCILKTDNRSDAWQLAFSLGLGYSITIAEYLILSLLHLDDFFPFFAVCVSMICVTYLIKKGDFNKDILLQRPSVQFFVCIIFLIVIFILEYYTVSLVYTLPGETPLGNAFHSDFLFWVGNNISATKGFPIQDFRQVGFEFNYHYFSSMFIAHMSMTTGIDIVILSMYFTSISAGCLLVFGLYALFATVFSDKIFLVITGYILFIFADGKYASFESHTFFMPFGYDYGIAMGMLAIATLIYLHSKKEARISDYVVTAIFLGICTGTKGPVGIVVLIGFGMSSLLFLSEKKWLRAFIGGVLWLGTFLVVYFLFIHGAYTSVGPSIDYVGLKGALRENPYINSVITEYSTLAALPEVFKAVVVILLYLFESSYVSNSLCIISLIIMAVMIVKKEDKKKCHLLLICNIITLWGNALGVVFNMPGGGSQIYFIMVTMPFALAAGLFAIQNLYKRRIITRSILIVVFLLSIFQCTKCIPKYYKRIKLGIDISNEVTVFWHPTGMYCMNTQYEAYCWIRENTEKNAIIALDNLGTMEEFNNQRELAGVMSERYIWNDDCNVFFADEAERRNSILKAISLLDNNTVKILQNEGVEYYLQNKQYSQKEINTSNSVRIVFDNDSYRVYQILERND